MRLRRGVAVAVLAVALLGGCGGDEGSSASTTAAPAADTNEPATVVLKGVKFQPERVTVKVDETVTWDWDDGTIAHDVNGGEVFQSAMQTEGTFEHTFEEPGSFDYKCTVHPTMTGSVEVEE